MLHFKTFYCVVFLLICGQTGTTIGTTYLCYYERTPKKNFNCVQYPEKLIDYINIFNKDFSIF